MSTTNRNLSLYALRYAKWLKANRNNDPIAGANDPPPDPHDYNLNSPTLRHAAALIRDRVERENQTKP